MLPLRLFFLPLILGGCIASIILQWNLAIGFLPQDARWWVWLVRNFRATGTMPAELLYPIYWSGAGCLLLMALAMIISARASTTTLHGGRDARNTHGSARWATAGDVRRARLMGSSGVVVGGWKGTLGIRALLHDGPEHILAFAPTRSGKGVGLVVPTLLSWKKSALVFDIKGENYALTAGWRASQGQRVIRFDPSAREGSARYNPLAEVRLGTDYQVADCQNIANMIIDPEGKGLNDFWMKEGWAWLSAVILHVLFRVHRDTGGQRVATLAEVLNFMAVGEDDDLSVAGSEADESFKALLDDMRQYEHGDAVANAVVRAGASGMRKRAPNERSGVHSSAKTDLSLYADPIVARNIAVCDFRIDDLMNADQPTSLYIVIPPRDIKRLRPLFRLMLNQILNRLMPDLGAAAAGGDALYRHGLLLMLDEFTALGKIEIFEEALAFMAGYGLKAFIIVQDMAQLHKVYGKDESITSNCHVRIAYAPNKLETARMMSDMTGKTTLVQRRRSRSRHAGQIGGNVSDSIAEVSRNLMTPDECMSMPGLREGFFGRKRPGHMLIFTAGQPAIYGRQFLYFQNRRLKKRSAMPAPAIQTATGDKSLQVVAAST
ncbi:type IV secretory system conjugative DNA transfer family protein [Ferrovibrio sp.]|uniref:type IV secretory system conjugative DNA transfer family protein n=1 Tax=Ferrovibrio sp. TaxID=1917215 RepID=UPI00311DA75B